MASQRRAWTIIAAVGGLCAVLIGTAVWLRSRALSPAALYQRLPQTNAITVYVDFDALRQAGILELLTGSKVEQEQDYRSFVQETGFDYTQDLHSVMAAFSGAGRFLLVNGRFDWKRLSRYSVSQSGGCENSFCRMTGSAPDRLISFFPIRSNLMALAVSRDPSAALRLSEKNPGSAALPDAPLWIMAPGPALKSGAQLPGDAGLLTGAVGDAEMITLAFVLESGRIMARLEVRCSSPASASAAASQLTKATATLRGSLPREAAQSGQKDLGAVLSAGNFWSEGNRARGQWVLETGFVRSLFR